MNHIKYLLFTRFKTFTLLSATMAGSIILLMIRMKLSHSFHFLFLVWNLFLAVIPFLITTYMTSHDKLNKLSLLFGFLLWLPFLPNAPYIITDLLHLNGSSTHIMWLDTLVVSSFALNGLLLFFVSLMDMQKVLSQFFKGKYINPAIFVILFLSGFGVYLGRFLRYNSWEIIQNPLSLFNDIIHLILHPRQHQEAWLFTILFSGFLSLGYWVYTSMTTNERY